MVSNLFEGVGANSFGEMRTTMSSKKGKKKRKHSIGRNEIQQDLKYFKNFLLLSHLQERLGSVTLILQLRQRVTG